MNPSNLKLLAEKMHLSFCMLNHTDQCSWGHESRSWKVGAHKKWLANATAFVKIIDRMTPDDVLKTVTVDDYHKLAVKLRRSLT